jgi:hypothetical protein
MPDPAKKPAPKRRPPKLIPLEQYAPPHVEPSLVTPGPPRLPLLRRVPQPFTVTEPCPGQDLWLVGLLNEHTALEYRSDYVVEVPAKSTRPPWTPQELAVHGAKRLNEYRGLVSLQRYQDGFVTFAALFVSNSMWTFCLRSTDHALCPPVRPSPGGWRPGEPLPPGLPRKPADGWPPPDCHHPERDPAKLSKTAQKQFA